MQTPDDAADVFVEDTLGKTREHSIAHNVTMKTTNAC